MRLFNLVASLCLLLLCLLTVRLEAQIPSPLKVPSHVPSIGRIDPPHWWVGMKNPELELLVYAPNIAKFRVRLKQDNGARLISSTALESDNYLFLRLDLSRAKAGALLFEFTHEGIAFEVEYLLKKREFNIDNVQGINSEDVIYLIMPDRFSNGDPTNDIVKGMKETRINRDSGETRHGGDLRGIINHLDYFTELGITALWLNPVLENNQPYASYHGYATTDHYNIDPRLGSVQVYKELVSLAHQKGIKVIQDIIHNHIGSEHYLYRDLPARDWVHQFDVFTRTSYRAPTLLDPYASTADKKIMTDGWFDKHMPDLNQQNPYIARYLIQSNIWWVEETGQDGFRIDTYAYPDQDFMRQWLDAIQTEYPEIGLFGEVWDHGPAVQAFFGDNTLANGNSTLPGLIDFQLHYAVNEAMSREMGWTEGIARVYYTLAQDFLYKDANRNVTFLDNHDLSRCFSVFGENVEKLKSALSFLLTIRGIPSIYYGTEIMMKNFASLSGVESREDFPGGWQGDKNNKFTAAGRTKAENEVFLHIRELLAFRKASSPITKGKLMQFVPFDGVYVYFRYTDSEAVMVAMNTHAKEKTFTTERFAERLDGYQSAMDITTKNYFPNLSSLTLMPYQTMVLSLRH